MLLTIRNIQLNHRHQKSEIIDYPKGRNYGILMQFTSRAKILTQDGLAEIYPGECVITFRDVPAYISALEDADDGFSNSYLVFEDDEPFCQAMKKYGVPHNRIIHETDFGSINSLFNKIYMENALALSMYREQIDLLLQEMLLRLGRSAAREETRSFLPNDRELIAALQNVRKEMYLDLLSYQTVQSMADAINVSSGYFRGIYKALFGISPKQDILHARIEKSKSLLTLTDKPLSHIADLCGFENENYFSRCFKAQVQLTPSAYRKQYSVFTKTISQK